MTAPGDALLAERLRPVHIGTRGDLEITRYVFRGEPVYVVRDPLTFHSYRLSASDYRIFTALDPSYPLYDIFEGLLARGALGPYDEEHFYAFVFQLHRIGFLHLPVSDDKLLFRRAKARRAAARRRLLLSPLFLRIPVWNPDAFLERTVHLAAPVFSRGFFLLWLLLQVAALLLLWSHRAELRNPLNGILAGDNLAIMWITLIVLKVFHEFGHAYACKRFGAEVREMGVYLIVLTPCAYVDASAAWGLPRTAQRVIIGLAGMYVELTIAALAVFAWAAAPPGALRAISFNVFLVAGAATILFNANPLMRYDGYYILSDLLGLPNLRARAQAALHALAKRIVLGLRQPPAATDDPRLLLLPFGAAAALYRVSVLAGIATMLALKLQAIGLVLAILVVGGVVVGALCRCLGYLWFSPETAPRRTRAVLAGTMLVLALPVAAGWLPIPGQVTGPAVITRTQEVHLRAPRAAFVEAVPLDSGATVATGDELVRLRDPELEETLLAAEADCALDRLRLSAAEAVNPTLAQQQARALQYSTARRDELLGRLAALSVCAPSPAEVMMTIGPDACGRFLPEGAPLVTLGTGDWEARILLDGADLCRASPHVGDPVELRMPGSAPGGCAGVIARVLPAGSRQVPYVELSQMSGGDLVVLPGTQQAEQAYFEVRVCLSTPPADLHAGMTGVISLTGRRVFLWELLWRRGWNFVHSSLVD